LRAAVLGANDGIVSTACLMLGVAAGSASTRTIVLTGFAGLVGGALSMAAGEYVSVSSQRDAELADRRREEEELRRFPEAELRELTDIYEQRGLDRKLASEVASQLHEHDALSAHLRDELRLDPDQPADPGRAASVSAVAFAVGAALPLATGAAAPGSVRIAMIVAVALVALAALGAVGARVGGGLQGRASVRVLVGGGLAMAASILIGNLVGAVV
jgi:VIT1/CCC1 family predicted Fe2+/Mn2+ transporter